MFVTAQRVSRATGQGVNAFLYWHGRDIAGEDPVALLDAPPGTLQLRLVEIVPGGNRVRSFLDVVLPDQSTRANVEAVLDLLDHTRQPPAFPVVLRFGAAASRIHMDVNLAPVWQDEVAELVEVARACLLSYPGLRVTPRYARKPGELDEGERAICLEAAALRETEVVLSLMRQLARARRLAEVCEVIRLYAQTRGDPKIGEFLVGHVPAIFSNYYVPTHGTDAFEKFVEWGIRHPEWASDLREAAAGQGSELARAADRIIRAASDPGPLTSGLAED